MDQFARARSDGRFVRLLPLISLLLVPMAVFAQAAGDNPFQTGATSVVSFLQTIGTPIAVIMVIVLSVAAMAGKVSWGWVIGVIVGIAAIFGAPRIVDWVKTMFNV